MEDTIAAISTALGMGGIAIVRVSGLCALSIGDVIFRSARGKVSDFSTHTLHFGTIVQDNAVLDQVMIAVFHAPHSYTRENILEIHCHGGLLTAQAVLALCLQHGARLAEPGEFTKRAFLNGRIDLTQAEAVMDLITAKTNRAQTVAMKALQGNLARRIELIRGKIMNVLVQIETCLDFPEDDIKTQTREELNTALDEIITQIEVLLRTRHEGQGLRSGVLVALVGRPNVGKSSLMNALLGRERCIVTPISGTTRDSIEDITVIRGFPVTLTDTAGYRNARGLVELEGVKKTLQVIREAQIILHVLDVSRCYSEADRTLANLVSRKRVIYVCNKIDLFYKIRLPSWIDAEQVVSVSALTGQGVDILRKSIGDALPSEDPYCKLDIAINLRQANDLKQALDSLQQARQSRQCTLEVELFAQDMRLALNAIDAISGRGVTLDKINNIFSSFCIGK